MLLFRRSAHSEKQRAQGRREEEWKERRIATLPPPPSYISFILGAARVHSEWATPRLQDKLGSFSLSFMKYIILRASDHFSYVIHKQTWRAWVSTICKKESCPRSSYVFTNVYRRVSGCHYTSSFHHLLLCWFSFTPSIQILVGSTSKNIFCGALGLGIQIE